MTFGEPSERSPFGPDGRAIAADAAMMLDNLSATVEGDWQDADIAALEDWAGLEVSVRGMHREGYGKPVQEFDQLWHRFHTALPFAEAERGWLRRIYGERPARFQDIPKIISYREERVVSAGIHKVVNGRDLMDRWLRWRRQSGEFSGEDTLDLACETLNDMIGLVAPGRSLADIKRGVWTT